MGEIANPGWGNYFYYLIVLSLAVWGLELVFPWRKNQPAFRKDFWLDAFYMFFNFFIFSLVGLPIMVLKTFVTFIFNIVIFICN